jgi:hypothetical protein
VIGRPPDSAVQGPARDFSRHHDCRSPLFAWCSPLWHRNRWLTGFALAHLAVLAVLLVLMMFDSRQITGVNIWLKPAKFAMSISIFLLTMAWLLGELRRPRWMIGAITVVVIASMTLEQVLITLQAARGVTSHYNNDTAFDAMVFSLMGLGVGTNSLAVGLALILFLGSFDQARPAYWWAIRCALLIFLLGSVQGFAMIANGGHTVGAPDGGPGIPVLAWSNVAGDLRIAHFIGIHAIQVLPLFGWWIDRSRLPVLTKITLVLIAAATYAGLGWLVHWLALSGESIF